MEKSTFHISFSGKGPMVLLGFCFFLFSAADSFCNSFLPVYAGTLMPLPFLSAGAAAGLPPSAFWFSVGLAQICAGWWERGRDHRTLMIGAMALTGAGQMLAGLATGLGHLVAARALCGLGFGAAMILTQDGLLRLVGPEARTRASGAYLSLFFAGTICGTPLGGWIAGRAGYGAAFVAAASLSAAAALLAAGLSSYRSEANIEPFRPGRLVKNRVLMALLILAAIPSRLINGAFVYYLAPVELREMNVPAAEAGRIAMLFPLILALSIPVWSWLADRLKRPLSFTILGLLVSAAAMAPSLLGWTDSAGIACAMAVLGLGQALGMSPQVTVLFTVAAEEIDRYGRPAVLGVFRVSERVGLFVGPMLGAWLFSDFGAAAAAWTLAVLMSAATLAFAAAIMRSRPRRAAALAPLA